MTSAKLEDSLSLSPESQRKAFDLRAKADLVVFYDSHSVNWPRKGSQPTPLSRLWDIIYEHEFTKKLERTPVMLTGGYDAWTKFVEMRHARHGQGANGSVAAGPSGRPGDSSVRLGDASAGGSGRPYNPKSGVLNGFERVPQLVGLFRMTIRRGDGG